MKYKNLMARALYDNVPESPEELAFCKGDVLTVLEQNTGGLEGWWLCSLHGRQGIAPGNRLKLLIGPAFEAHTQPPATVQGSATRDGLYQVSPSQQGVYQVPQRGGRTSEKTPSKVVTPTRVGHSYAFSQPHLYDVPPVRLQGVYDIPQGKQQEPALRGKFGLPCQQGVYDVPPTTQGVYSIPPCRNVPDAQEGNYDFPQPLKAKPEGIYDVPPATFAKAPQSNYDFLPSCPSALLRSSAPNKEGVYDVPPQQSYAGSQRDVYDIPRGKPPSQERTPDSRVKDVVDGVDHISFSSPPRNAAVRQLALLQRDVSSVSALLASAVSPGQRAVPFAAVSTALDRLHAALAELQAIGVTAAEAAGDPSLRSQLQRLQGSEQILLQVSRTMEPQGDSLGSVVAVCKSASDVAQRLSRTLSDRSGHGGEAFSCQEETERDGGLALEKISQREREQCIKSWMEDYDYVHLQGKEEFERQQKELLEKENLIKQDKIHLGQEQLIQFKQLEQEVTKPVENDITQWVSQQPGCGPSHEGGSWQCGRDVQLLRFYSEQCQAHFASLLGAMDVFFGCVRAGHPPRVFVAHSKSVILIAHKLVFVGDTLARQVSSAERAERVVGGSNALCQLLKVVVGATKAAALHYPSTAALQEMVDRVTDLSHQAQQFKAQLLQMAAS